MSRKLGATSAGGDEIDRKLASAILRRVSLPDSFLFFADTDQCTWNSVRFVQCITDFCERLREIPSSSIEAHFKRGDFERWIGGTLGDAYLADRIGKINKSIRGEELRRMIGTMVRKRIDRLRALIV